MVYMRHEIKDVEKNEKLMEFVKREKNSRLTKIQ